VPIHFTCPQCGSSTEVADQYAGQSGPCAKCGRMVTIPFAGGGPVYAAPVPARSMSGWVVALIVALVALPVLVACGGVLVALLLPAIQAARGAARQAACANNLKMITVALQAYHNEHGSFPPAYSVDENGKPMHSWRVLILPHLGEDALYRQFKLDEPWDSPHNQALANRMPAVFRCQADRDAQTGETSYLMIVGPGTVADGPKAHSIDDISDGLSSTIIVTESCGSGVNWLEPRDCDVQNQTFLVNSGTQQGFESDHAGKVNVAFGDGSVRALSDDTDPNELKAMTTIAGGEPVVGSF
jgi:prepilin-type processing-associated H-X9-DG protein